MAATEGGSTYNEGRSLSRSRGPCLPLTPRKPSEAQSVVFNACFSFQSRTLQVPTATVAYTLPPLLGEWQQPSHANSTWSAPLRCPPDPDGQRESPLLRSGIPAPSQVGRSLGTTRDRSALAGLASFQFAKGLPFA